MDRKPQTKGDIFMRMEKRKFRIGELAGKIGVEQFVIRFWEKEFGIKPARSQGGQRFYQEKELKRFEQIKDLLYRKKFTIAGAKLELKKRRDNDEFIIPSKTTTFESEINKLAKTTDRKEILEQFIELKDKLAKLKELL